MGTEYIGVDYLFAGFNQEAIIRQALGDLSNVDFDAVVVTGVSGMLAGPLVAYALGKPLLVVRKPDDKSSHSYKRIEGRVPSKRKWKWLFVDDFVSEGGTLSRVIQEMDKCFGGDAELKGAWEYYRRIYPRVGSGIPYWSFHKRRSSNRQLLQSE